MTTLAFAGLALFIGLMLGAGLMIPALALSSVVLVPLAALIVISALGSRFDAIFWLLLLSVLLSGMVSAITRRPLSFVSTGILLAAAPLILHSVLTLSHNATRAVLLSFLLVGFFAVGVLSSIAGRSQFLPALYTTVMTLKPFLLVGLGAALVWSDRTQRVFYFVVRWAWLPLLLVALVQWFAPSVYLSLLADVEMIPENNPVFPGYPRASALFQHPSVLAACASMFGLIAIIDSLLQRRVLIAFPCVFYLLLLLMSGQRQELAAALVSVPLAYAMIRWRPSFPLLVGLGVGAIFVAVAAIGIVAPDTVTQELRNWGVIGSSGNPESARAILYGDAIRLANQYWPLGTGFGTFASVGSVKFDQSLFDTMGYGSFWWFTKKSYLMDAYWAKYIAETGWIGFTLHLTFYVLVLKQVVDWARDPRVRASPSVFRVSLFAFVGMSYVLLTSPTAFSLSEPHGGMIPLMFVGIAWRRVKLLYASSPAPVHAKHRGAIPARA